MSQERWTESHIETVLLGHNTTNKRPSQAITALIHLIRKFVIWVKVFPGWTSSEFIFLRMAFSQREGDDGGRDLMMSFKLLGRLEENFPHATTD